MMNQAGYNVNDHSSKLNVAHSPQPMDDITHTTGLKLRNNIPAEHGVLPVSPLHDTLEDTAELSAISGQETA
jgi:hypothetical protein